MNKQLLNRYRPLWPWAVLLFAIAFILAQLIQWGASLSAIRKATSRSAQRDHSEAVSQTTLKKSAGIETVINQAAKKTGVSRLLSINAQESTDGPQLQIEAEGKQSSLINFLYALETSPELGACVRLHVLGSSSVSPIRISMLFNIGGHPIEEAPIATSRNFKRDIFISLWQEQVKTVDDAALIQAKRLEEQQQKDQLRAQEEQRNRAAEEQLASKRRELENAYVLTGIVNNGKELIAFISQKSAGGTSIMLRQDDVVNDARVTRIDDKKGEMQLDYQGKFQLLYHINAVTNGSPTQ